MDDTILYDSWHASIFLFHWHVAIISYQYIDTILLLKFDVIQLKRVLIYVYIISAFKYNLPYLQYSNGGH